MLLAIAHVPVTLGTCLAALVVAGIIFGIAWALGADHGVRVTRKLLSSTNNYWRDEEVAPRDKAIAQHLDTIERLQHEADSLKLRHARAIAVLAGTEEAEPCSPSSASSAPC